MTYEDISKILEILVDLMIHFVYRKSDRQRQEVLRGGL